mgnify:FL=1
MLGNYTGTKDVIRVPIEGNPKAAISLYRELTGDETTVFIIADEKEMKCIKQKYLKQWEK